MSSLNAVVELSPPSGRTVRMGNRERLTIIAGPCQLESRQHALETASMLAEIAGRLEIGLVYKTSFDKANRTSARAARGIGLKSALPIFAEIRETLGLPVLTDVHEREQCAAVAEAVDVLQIPAFLCRQTDLLVAAAETGRAINVKKGQFLAPWDMKNVIAKISGAGNPNALATERGVSFGYNALVSDMRALWSSTPPIPSCSPAARETDPAASGNSCPCWPERPSPSGSPRCSWRPTRTRTMRPPTGRTWCRCGSSRAS